MGDPDGYLIEVGQGQTTFTPTPWTSTSDPLRTSGPTGTDCAT